MFSIFAKKCGYCQKKIPKGQETMRDVKVLGYVGTRPMPFCSDEHAGSYVQEIESHTRKQQTEKSSGGCCG